MKKGLIDPRIAVVLLITAVIGIVVLDSFVAPITGLSGQSELMNLTVEEYKAPLRQPITDVIVYNNTDCMTDVLIENVDYIVDTPFNGNITGAGAVSGPIGNALEFSKLDSVVMEETTIKGSLTENITIIGWVKPKNI